jgi:signal transduction histidine kinase
VPFVINYQRRLQVAFHLFHPLFFVIILIRTEHSLFILPEVTKEQAALVGAFNTIILILVSHYIISEIIRVTSRAEASLFRSEAQLKEQNIELQKINEELDAFVYSLGHDLRAPVASALGLVNISKDEQDITTLHQYNLLKEKSLLRLDSFIEDILHYARNARTGVKTEDVHLSAEIRNTVLLNQMSAEAQHIQIIFELNDTIVLSTDRYRLGLILNNLISNAFRYHNPHMAHPWILIKTIDQKDSVEIIVQDNGIGIGEEHLDKIFQIFYQANDRVKSSGLGLYILKEAVHRLQGEVSVASELDRGTTFCVELPKNRT